MDTLKPEALVQFNAQYKGKAVVVSGTVRGYIELEDGIFYVVSDLSIPKLDPDGYTSVVIFEHYLCGFQQPGSKAMTKVLSIPLE